MMPAKRVIIVGRQQEIMRTGLAGDVDAARLGFAQRPQLLGRRDVQDVNARAGPFGEDGGAADRLDRDDRGPRGDMRRTDRCRPAAIKPLLTPLHDRVGLGVQRDPLAGRRHDLEGFQHRAGRGRGDLAEGVAHIELEADHAAVDQRRHVGDGVLAEQAVEAEIDMQAFLAAIACLAASISAVPVGGMVFGMSNTVVTPPNAAAAVPLAQSSLCG